MFCEETRAFVATAHLVSCACCLALQQSSGKQTVQKRRHLQNEGKFEAWMRHKLKRQRFLPAPNTAGTCGRARAGSSPAPSLSAAQTEATKTTSKLEGHQGWRWQNLLLPHCDQVRPVFVCGMEVPARIQEYSLFCVVKRLNSFNAVAPSPMCSMLLYLSFNLYSSHVWVSDKHNGSSLHSTTRNLRVCQENWRIRQSTWRSITGRRVLDSTFTGRAQK